MSRTTIGRSKRDISTTAKVLATTCAIWAFLLLASIGAWVQTPREEAAAVALIAMKIFASALSASAFFFLLALLFGGRR